VVTDSVESDSLDNAFLTGGTGRDAQHNTIDDTDWNDPLRDHRARLRDSGEQKAASASLEGAVYDDKKPRPMRFKGRGKLGSVAQGTVAASAEAHRVINRPKVNRERIAIGPTCRRSAGRTARLTRRERSQHRTAKGARGRAGTVSAGGSGGWKRNCPLWIMWFGRP
jgi:hypothetical protein